MPTRPNVLFLLSDQHNYRYTGHQDPAKGGEPAVTSALDQIAENGTVFEQTYCQMPLCTPSRICMLTGREVQRAGA
jgi:arylsulfatase A-like enzyme